MVFIVVRMHNIKGLPASIVYRTMPALAQNDLVQIRANTAEFLLQSGSDSPWDISIVRAERLADYIALGYGNG